MEVLHSYINNFVSISWYNLFNSNSPKLISLFSLFLTFSIFTPPGACSVGVISIKDIFT